jgi:hypothetical protein
MRVILRRILGLFGIVLGIQILTSDAHLLKRYGRERTITGFEKNAWGFVIVLGSACMLLQRRDSDEG